MKVVLFGRSGVGKSTLAPNIGKAFGLNVLELDDETERLNGGVWPDDEATIDHYFALIHLQALEMDSGLYITSWLEPDEVADFHQKGFTIVILDADLDTLVNRKKRRGDTIDEEHFLTNYERCREIFDLVETRGMVSLKLDTTHLSPLETERAVATFLKSINS